MKEMMAERGEIGQGTLTKSRWWHVNCVKYIEK